MSQSDRQNILAATLLAGAAGAGIGLLFAPRSGKETRQKLRDATMQAKDRANDKLETAREKMDDKLDKARDVKDKLVGTIRKDRNRPMEDESLESPIITAWNEEV